MSYPMLPIPATGEVLLVSTCYKDDRALWDEVLQTLGGHRDGDVLVLADEGVRLRLVENPLWNSLYGGNFPALVPAGSQAPVVALADIPAAYGGGAVLLVDLREIPGRGVRVPTESLDRVLAGLFAGTLRFDELVEGMDRYGDFQGDGEEPATPTPTDVIRTSFPPLPAIEATLLVRTDFNDEHGWRNLLDGLGELDHENRTHADFDNLDEGEVGFEALVVDDREFESLQPGQVPALVPPKADVTMVALADAVTLADPDLPLLVVDLYDTPGQAIRIPLAEVGSMAANLEISNMDFSEFG